MQVILIEQVEKLGEVGNVVNVKNGFARNFLIPQKKALRATDENKKYYEAKKEEILLKNDKLKAGAQKLYNRIHGKDFTLIRHASDEGRLYGSVMPKDIAEAASQKFGITIEKSQIILAKIIKDTGVFHSKIRFHAEFLADLVINIARTEDEAKLNLEKTKNPEKFQQQEELEEKQGSEAKPVKEETSDVAEADSKKENMPETA